MVEIDSRNMLMGIGLILLVVAIAGCTSSNTTYSGPTKTYSANGVTFNYPASWELNDTSDSIKGFNVFLYDPQKTKNQGVIVTKVNRENMTFQEYVDSMINGFKRFDVYVSDRSLTINGMNAHEVVTSPGGETTRMITVYIEPKPGQVYSATILDTPQDVEQWRQYQNLVLNSFKVQ